jgi:integrase
MIESLGNMENTYYKSLAWIKSMLTRAKVKGLIKNNVFENYPLKQCKGHREFLTMQELKQLESMDLKLLPASERNIYNYFLFACYIGLRYTDLKNLRFNEIKDNKYIQLTMHKTKDIVTIPLSKQAKQLIGEGFENQKVFRVLTNQKSNEYLKEIMKKAKISKSISFHCARHTLATISIEIGIPLEVTSKLLGHTDIKTTQIYARILETKKFNEMERWNRI